MAACRQENFTNDRQGIADHVIQGTTGSEIHHRHIGQNNDQGIKLFEVGKSTNHSLGGTKTQWGLTAYVPVVTITAFTGEESRETVLYMQVV